MYYFSMDNKRSYIAEDFGENMKIQAKRSASKKQTQIRKVAADSEINLSLLREDEEESADKREVCATSQSHRGGEKAKLRAVFFKKFLCGQVVGWLQILLDTISHDRIYFLFLCQAHCIGVFIRITCMRYNNMFTHSFILHFRGEFFLFLKSCIQILDCPLQFDIFDVHL